MSELIAEAVREPDDARREGLLGLADQWMEAARRRRDAPPFDRIVQLGPQRHALS